MLGLGTYSEVSQNVAPSSTARSRILNCSSSLGGVPYAPHMLIRSKPGAGTFGPFLPSWRSGMDAMDILMCDGLEIEDQDEPNFG